MFKGQFKVRLPPLSAYHHKRPTHFKEISHNQNSFIRKYSCDDKADEQRRKKIQLTSIDLFLWKSNKHNQPIYCPFQLVKLDEKYTPPKDVNIEHLQNTNFPVLRYSAKDLINFSVKILRTSQFCNSNFTARVTQKMMTLIARNYNAVAYHNFSHSFYFTMLVYQCFNREFHLKHICTDQEYFYILAAGFCHDLNHNGSTNGFQVKTKSQLATYVNNQSVLQNMHIRHLWKIFQENPDLSFIAPAKDRVRAKQLVTRLILSTDMFFHGKNLQKFKEMKKSPHFDLKRNSEHKWLVIQQVFHACDIGNACTDYNNYIAWGALLSHQFNSIAKQQKSLNLEVTKCFQLPSIESVYKDQVWFIGCLVQPIWKEIGDIFPSLSPLLANIDNNMKRVKAELQKLKN